ncbi:MAG: thiosulfate oxidation carrier complex protein SoxZ [Pseudomonadota bacterium]
MASPKPRVKIPKKVAAGEAFTVKTLISHPMESGVRKDKKTGELIPRKIINTFEVSFEGESVISVDIDPAVSANPYFEFQMKVPGPGAVKFAWTDDDGSVYEQEKKIEIG